MCVGGNEVLTFKNSKYVVLSIEVFTEIGWSTNLLFW